MAEQEGLKIDIEDHSGEAICRGQWCCGCDEHPIGKPWGWNYRAWEDHNDRFHSDSLQPDSIESERGEKPQ